jgi:DNA repair protein RadC
MTPYSTPPLTIKQWAEDDRPREKLLLKGRQALSDAELIAILIATGTHESSAVDLAKQLLSLTANNLTDLGKLSVADLKGIKGIGEAKAISVIAALELGRRRKLEEAIQLSQLTTSKEIFDVMEPVVGDLPHEEFWVLTLNRSSKMTGRYKLSSGGVHSTIVDIRLLCRHAIQQLADSIVLVHNHPSGRKEPSDQDRVLTRKIKDALNYFDIGVNDHVIISNKEYFSFADNEML